MNVKLQMIFIHFGYTRLLKPKDNRIITLAGNLTVKKKQKKKHMVDREYNRKINMIFNIVSRRGLSIEFQLH